MACNVCGEKVKKCENGECSNDLESSFYCFKEHHFCSESCWICWLADEEIGNLEDAENDGT